MKINSPISKALRKSQGLSLTSFLLVLVTGGTLGIAGMRAAPVLIEHSAVKRVVQRMESSGETNPSALKNTFDAAASVDNISSVTSDDLEITQQGANVVIRYQYTARAPLIGNVSLAFDFKK